eukprot:COSAG06_NODE_7690_length_2411_cov_2.316176_2_plen_82_part_00
MSATHAAFAAAAAAATTTAAAGQRGHRSATAGRVQLDQRRQPTNAVAAALQQAVCSRRSGQGQCQRDDPRATDATLQIEES